MRELEGQASSDVSMVIAGIRFGRTGGFCLRVRPRDTTAKTKIIRKSFIGDFNISMKGVASDFAGMSEYCVHQICLL